MAKRQFVPWFYGDYMADCHHLSDAEHGRYLLLLGLMWFSPGCRVPNDDAWLGRRLNRTESDIAKLWRPLIFEFCQSDGNWIWQKRLRKEHAWSQKQSRQQSERAKSRWKKRNDASGNDAGRHDSGNAPTPPHLINTPPTPPGRGGDDASPGKEKGRKRRRARDADHANGSAAPAAEPGREAVLSSIAFRVARGIRSTAGTTPSDRDYREMLERGLVTVEQAVAYGYRPAEPVRR